MIFEDGYFSARDRHILLAFLFGVALLTAIDIVEDVAEGASIFHVLTEGVVVAGCLLAAIGVWRRTFNRVRVKTKALKEQLTQANQDLAKWQELHSRVSTDLHSAMAQQFQAWKLTNAQQDIALLLLKGLSLKEIAQARNTSERTVRHQAAAIYKLAGLEGRTQLSAFFLEHLLSS